MSGAGDSHLPDAKPTTGASQAQDVALAFEAAIGTGDLEQVAGLLHPQARVETLADGAAAAHPASDLLVVLRDVEAKGVYATSVSSAEQLDEGTVLIEGRARYSAPAGGFVDESVAWLDEIRDGLLWRRRVYATGDEARAAHEATTPAP